MGRQTRVGLTGVLLGAGLLLPALGLQFQDVDAPPISYSDTPAVDQVARLGEKLKRGELKLTRHPERGYLDSFLQALGISPSSQLLVFSKTSFQRERISPVTPRALYFNDDVYVGWVQGGPVLEISAADPHLGGVFYVLDQESNAPRPLRQRHECLSCHESGLTGGVPGHTLRSVLSLRDGLPAFSSGAYVMTPESSFDQRW
ncbi:MAG: hypothetical protein FJX77_14960, partial [Armatimonadetes bacterium]|nr:hypothetical protein [Armatimonadota bacterium]